MFSTVQRSAGTDGCHFITHGVKSGQIKFPCLVCIGSVHCYYNSFVFIRIVCSKCGSFAGSDNGVTRTDISWELSVCVIFHTQGNFFVIMVCCCKTPVSVGRFWFPFTFQSIHGKVVIVASFVYPCLSGFAAVCMHINSIPQDPCGTFQSVYIGHHTLCKTKCCGHLSCIGSCSISTVNFWHPQVLSCILCSFF